MEGGDRIALPLDDAVVTVPGGAPVATEINTPPAIRRRPTLTQ